MPVADLGDVRLYYEERGTGRPLVLMHGGWVDLSSLEPNIPALAARCRVIAFDRRGCGRSVVLEGEHSPEAWTEDLYRLLRTLELSRACVGGVSYGAMVAVEFALAHPEMVDGLVLIAGTAEGFPGRGGGYVGFPRRLERLGEITAPVLLIHGDADPVFPLWHAEHMQRALPNARLVVVEGAGHGVNWEDAATVNGAILEFLAGLEGSPAAGERPAP
ncbi:MAG TPA: alpha/beta hydrolase [Dehalococcoidia bacterium]